MKRIFYYYIFFSLTLACSFKAIALVPLQGLIYGDVRDTKQYDPLSGVFSQDAISNPDQVNSVEETKFQEYIGLYKDGANLKNSCEQGSIFQYDSPWKEATAKRSIVSTLQYIGLDISLKAIVEYAKLLELPKENFDNIVENLITNTCSKNLSVYSIKLLRNNFKHYYENNTGFVLPDITKSPYFSKSIKELTNSHQAKNNEFNLTLKNFRAFCSWNGDADNYRMLVSYLNNPYVMSYIYNHMSQKKIKWDSKTKEILHVDDPKGIMVGCEDLICRKKDFAGFTKLFPRIIGSTKIEDDFNNLFCGHFHDISFKLKEQNPIIKTWINQQSIEEPILEAMNFVSLISGVPDIAISSKKYSELISSISSSLDNRWDKWANEKSNQFVNDILYEESLNIDLVPMAETLSIQRGDFQLVFDFTLGELDRVLNVVDKITSKFHLNFPKSFLHWVRKEHIRRSNKSDYAGIAELEKQVMNYVAAQLESKKDLFLIPLWSDRMGNIIAKELVTQLVAYRGSAFRKLSNKNVKIPVKFRYGLFALKYLRNKFKSKYRSQALTYKNK